MDPALFEGLFAEVLAPLVDGTLNKLSARAAWKKVEDHQAAEAYKTKLTKRYGTIQILGQPRPQKLGKVYTDVYLHEKPTHSYAMQVEKLEEMFREQNKRFGRKERTDGLAFAKKHNRLFILGKPGAGKTTFLKYLTMQATIGDIPMIPIFVSLNDFQHQNTSILDYITEQFDVCNFPDAQIFIEQLLIAGKGLILLDGLDEVSKEDNQRSQITRQLKNFIDKYDLNRFAITCRIAASDYNFSGFDYVEMADFSDAQVEVFVFKWFREATRKIESFLNELKKADNEGIKEMTTSPLLLTLLCIQFDGSMALPPSRSEIYEEALEVLMKTWDGQRDINRGELIVEDEDRYKALTFKRKMQLMSHLAWRTFREGKLFIEQKWLEDNIVKYLGKIPKGPDPDLIDGGIVLKAMESQHGLLVERASRIYSFSHLTLQEYFTAKYIVDHAQTDAALSTLVSEEKITDPRWREVFLFVADLLPIGDELVIWFAETLQNMAERGDVQTLVHWVEKRSIERPFANSQIVSRISYLNRASAHKRATVSLKSAINSSTDNFIKTKFYDSASLNSILGSYIDANTNPRARTLVGDNASFHATDLISRLENDKRNALAYALESIIASSIARALYHNSISDNDHFKVIKKAISESKFLDWDKLTNALQKIPQSSMYGPHSKHLEVWEDLKRIEQEIILDNWSWQAEEVEDIKTLNAWLNGHQLLISCLDRVMLEDLNREEFEDEYLYRLPPHARPKLNSKS